MSQEIEQKEIDDLISNLKVLSQLEANKKIMAKENIINIETESYIPESIRRTYRGDSREVTIKKIDSLIILAINLTIDNKFDFSDNLLKSKKGIFNLIETYSDCSKTRARLNTIIDKIDRFLKN
tara:strand:+ start:337 stop:708 length:372 start_codon:yes stop_codon:yes gene_type:complete